MSHNIDGNYVAEDTTKEIMILMGKELVGLINSNHTIAHQHDNNMISEEEYQCNINQNENYTLDCIWALRSCILNKEKCDVQIKDASLCEFLDKFRTNIKKGRLLYIQREKDQKIEQEAVIMYNSHAQRLFHYTIAICEENIHALNIVREMKEEMKELKERLERIIDTQEELQKNKKKSMWALRNSYTVEDLDL